MMLKFHWDAKSCLVLLLDDISRLLIMLSNDTMSMNMTVLSISILSIATSSLCSEPPCPA